MITAQFISIMVYAQSEWLFVCMCSKIMKIHLVILLLLELHLTSAST